MYNQVVTLIIKVYTSLLSLALAGLALWLECRPVD